MFWHPWRQGAGRFQIDSLKQDGADAGNAQDSCYDEYRMKVIYTKGGSLRTLGRTFVVLQLFLGHFTVSAGTNDAIIYLLNETGYDIIEVYCVPLGAKDFGKNKLQEHVLGSGQTAKISLREDHYILIVRAKVDDSIVEIEDSSYFENGVAYEWNVTVDDIAYFSGGFYGDPYTYYEDVYGYLDLPYAYLYD